MPNPIDVSSYVVIDPHFGAPYIDLDEPRERPSPHRFVHGGFAGTDTRFAFYFPDAEFYQGRMFQPIEGGHGGNEVVFGGGMLGEMFQRIALSARLGGYMVESNQGHIGDSFDPKAGEDPSLYGHRASAEVARLSKLVAEQVYGSAPHHSYVWGGSGGGRRSPLCLENAPDVWDGAMPSTSGGEIAEPGNNKRVRSGGPIGFGQMFNVQRLLGRDKIAALADAMAPGGSGNPFDGLTTHQREELARLYRLGFPRGDEGMIAEPMGQMWLWTSMAEELAHDDPEYFEKFWTTPGYVGHDMPEAVNGDLINDVYTVSRVLTIRDLQQSPEFAGPEYQTMRMLAAMIGTSDLGADMPYAIEVDGLDHGYRVGTGVRVVSGDAAGRQLYATGATGAIFACDGQGDANLKRFIGVVPGDQVHIDNRKFLAFCYYARHHVIDEPQFSSLSVDGKAIYPQHEPPLMSSLMGVCYTGKYDGKLIWIHHTHDSSVWPAYGLLYAGAVLQAQGPQGAAKNFRIRWNENAEHGPPAMVPAEPNRASSTRLIDFTAVTEQTLADLVNWVENGVEPLGCNYGYSDGKVLLPSSAAERGGIQPVVSVTADDCAVAHVAVGESVTVQMVAEVHPDAGRIISVEWDLDGSGTFARRDVLDGTKHSVTRTITHSFDRPGTYFVTARVESNREADPQATRRRIPNVAQARVVVS